MRIVFFGPPGSGKGTQAKLLASELNISHLSTGDILRNKLKDKDELSSKLNDIMSSGNLVSDEILNQIVADKIISDDCVKGFILDGYPRTIAQSNYLLLFCEKNNLKIDFVFNFEIDFETVEKRIIHRSEMEMRSDDSTDVIKTRLDKYINESLPVSKIFRKNLPGNYFSVDASQEISIIQKEIINIVKNGEI